MFSKVVVSSPEFCELCKNYLEGGDNNNDTTNDSNDDDGEKQKKMFQKCVLDNDQNWLLWVGRGSESLSCICFARSLLNFPATGGM